MKIYLLLLLLIIAVLLSFSCARTSSPVSPLTSVPPVNDGPAQLPWEREWNNILLESKKEGKVVVFSTAGAGTREALSGAFKNKYNIPLEFIAGRSEELNLRLIREYNVGLTLVDIFLGGVSPTITQLKPAGILNPLEPVLILPEVLDQNKWWQNKFPWIDKDKTIMASLAFPLIPFVINGKLASAEEFQSWTDLLNSKWKGKISIDNPTIGGPGLAWFSVVGEKIMGYDYLRQLVKQEPAISRDWRLQIEWLAQGKHVVAVAPLSGPVAEFLEAGAPLKIIMPREGHGLSTGNGGLSLIKKAPHPYAATLFINWLLSKEGMSVFSKAEMADSARLDTTAGDLPEAKRRQPGMNYFMRDNEEFLLRTPEFLEKAREIFGPLTR